MVATIDDVTSSQATARPVSSRAEVPEFPVALSGVEPGANPPVEPKAPVFVTPAAAPAAPVAAMSGPTPPPMAAAATVVADGAPAIVAPATGEQPVSFGLGMPPTPVVLPVGKTDPVLSLVAWPALPATPKTARAASAIFQPKIYEQQILSGENVPLSPVGTPAFAPPRSEPLSAPAAVALETPSDVVDLAHFALLTATASAKTGNPLPIAQEFRANPMGQTPVPPTAAGNLDRDVPPTFAKVRTIGTIGAEIQNLPMSDAGASTPPALPRPVMVAVNPVTTVPTTAVAALQPTIDEQQILPVPQAALSPIQVPVVDFAPVVANETKPSSPIDSRSQPQLPATAVGACLPVRRAQGPEPVEGQAIDPRPTASAAAPEDKSRASSLLQLNVSSDVQPAPLTNLTTPAPGPVPALPGSVAAASRPVPPVMPAVANPVLTTAPTDTLEPKVDTPPVLSGQEMPVPAVEPPVAGVSRSTPVMVPAGSVAKPTSGLVPIAVVASEISPARAHETIPVVAPGSRPIRKGHRPPTWKAPAPTAVAPALANTSPLGSVAVAPATVANPGIPTTASLIAPVVSASPALSDPNAVTRPVVPPAVLPAAEIAVPTGGGAQAAPRLPRTTTAVAGDDLGSVLAAPLNSISTPVTPDPGSAPTGKTGASDDLEDLRAPASVSRQASTAGISVGLPLDLMGNRANLAPAAAAAPTGLPEISSPVSAPAVSVGTELPATASVAAFSSPLDAASRSPVTALPGDSRDARPSTEEADPVAPGVDFPPQAAVRMRPIAETAVARSVAAGDGILTTPLPRTRTTVASRTAARSDNLGLPASPGVTAPAGGAGSGEAAMPAATLPTFGSPAGTLSEALGANVAPAASGQVTDVKPESSPAISPAAPTGDTAPTPLPVSNLDEVRGQPASVAADANAWSTAGIPVAGPVPEKFAAQAANDGAEQGGGSERISVKNTIKLAGQQVEMTTAHAGINAAKKSGTMPSDQPQTSSAAPTSKSSAPVADTAARFDASTVTAPKSEPNRTEWVQPAGRTLAIVRDVAERIQTTANRVVEFDVNSQPGTQLSVRLEYRGGVVHTTFRTDSTDLRDTLTREWQSTMPSVVAGERSVRLAEPTFTPASAPRGDSQSFDLGGQTTRQQQQDTPQPQEKAAFGSEFAFARGASPRRTAAAVPAADTTVASTVRPDTAQHLHAFA